MSDGNDTETVKGRLSLRPAGRSDVGRTVDAGSVRQSFSHGRTKVVQVEVRKKRTPVAGAAAPAAQTPAAAPTPAGAPPRGGAPAQPRPAPGARALTATELAVRARVLAEQQREAARREQERREQEKISILSAAEEARRREEEAKRAAEEEARPAEIEARKQAEEEAARAAAA